MKNTYIAVMVTCATSTEARTIVKTLLSKRLIACGNIVPGVESLFRWKGRIDRATEVLVIIKTLAGHFKRIEEEVKRLHSYEVPEIIAVPIIGGSKKYLQWIDDSVQGKSC